MCSIPFNIILRLTSSAIQSSTAYLFRKYRADYDCLEARPRLAQPGPSFVYVVPAVVSNPSHTPKTYALPASSSERILSYGGHGLNQGQ